MQITVNFDIVSENNYCGNEHQKCAYMRQTSEAQYFCVLFGELGTQRVGTGIRRVLVHFKCYDCQNPANKYKMLVVGLFFPFNLASTLKKNNIQTVGEVTSRTKEQLLRLPGMGPVRLVSLVECLSKHHLKLAGAL